MKRRISKTIIVLTLFMAFCVQGLYAAGWDWNYIGSNVSLSFTLVEEPFFIPVSAVFQGSWQECWRDGSKGSTARLDQLWHSGVHFNYFGSTWVDDMVPFARYNNTYEYDIDTYQSWILHGSSNGYAEGYCNPNTYLSTGSSTSTNGRLRVWAMDTLELWKDVSYTWTTHYR